MSAADEAEQLFPVREEGAHRGTVSVRISGSAVGKQKLTLVDASGNAVATYNLRDISSVYVLDDQTVRLKRSGSLMAKITLSFRNSSVLESFLEALVASRPALERAVQWKLNKARRHTARRRRPTRTNVDMAESLVESTAYLGEEEEEEEEAGDVAADASDEDLEDADAAADAVEGGRDGDEDDDGAARAVPHTSERRSKTRPPIRRGTVQDSDSDSESAPVHYSSGEDEETRTAAAVGSRMSSGRARRSLLKSLEGSEWVQFTVSRYNRFGQGEPASLLLSRRQDLVQILSHVTGDTLAAYGIHDVTSLVQHGYEAAGLSMQLRTDGSARAGAQLAEIEAFTTVTDEGSAAAVPRGSGAGASAAAALAAAEAERELGVRGSHASTRVSLRMPAPAAARRRRSSAVAADMLLGGAAAAAGRRRRTLAQRLLSGRLLGKARPATEVLVTENLVFESHDDMRELCRALKKQLSGSLRVSLRKALDPHSCLAEFQGGWQIFRGLHDRHKRVRTLCVNPFLGAVLLFKKLDSEFIGTEARPVLRARIASAASLKARYVPKRRAAVQCEMATSAVQDADLGIDTLASFDALVSGIRLDVARNAQRWAFPVLAGGNSSPAKKPVGAVAASEPSSSSAAAASDAESTVQLKQHRGVLPNVKERANTAKAAAARAADSGAAPLRRPPGLGSHSGKSGDAAAAAAAAVDLLKFTFDCGSVAESHRLLAALNSMQLLAERKLRADAEAVRAGGGSGVGARKSRAGKLAPPPELRAIDATSVQTAAWAAVAPNASSRRPSVLNARASVNVPVPASTAAARAAAAALDDADADAPGEWFSSVEGIFVGTFNVGDASPPRSQDLDAWIPPPRLLGDIKVLAIGLQEVNTKFDEWAKAVSAHLGGDFEPAISIRMWEIGLLVYVHLDELTHISNTTAGSVKTGLRVAKGIKGGVQLGNKGGVAIGFRWRDVPVCFINAHLSAHQTKVAERNHNFSQIMSKLALAGAPGRAEAFSFEPTLAFEHVFMLGDLNYRVDLDFKQAENATMLGNFALLHLNDQLQRELKAGRSFHGFRTALPEFAPTYRWKRGRRELSNKREQPPSYTDRILWHARPGAEAALRVMSHYSAESIMISDHRPVAATFALRLRHEYSWPCHPLTLIDSAQLRALSGGSNGSGKKPSARGRLLQVVGKGGGGAPAAYVPSQQLGDGRIGWSSRGGDFFVTPQDALLPGAPELLLQNVVVQLRAPEDGNALPTWVRLGISSPVLHNVEWSSAAPGCESSPDARRGRGDRFAYEGVGAFQDLFYSFDTALGLPRLHPTLFDPIFLRTQHLLLQVYTLPAKEEETLSLGHLNLGAVSDAAAEEQAAALPPRARQQAGFRGQACLPLRSAIEAVGTVVRAAGLAGWTRENTPRVPFSEPIIVGGVEVGRVLGDLCILPPHPAAIAAARAVSRPVFRAGAGGHQAAQDLFAAGGFAPPADAPQPLLQGFVHVLRRGGNPYKTSALVFASLFRDGRVVFTAKRVLGKTAARPHKNVLQEADVSGCVIEEDRDRSFLLRNMRPAFAGTLTDSERQLPSGAPFAAVWALDSRAERAVWIEALESVYRFDAAAEAAAASSAHAVTIDDAPPAQSARGPLEEAGALDNMAGLLTRAVATIARQAPAAPPVRARPAPPPYEELPQELDWSAPEEPPPPPPPSRSSTQDPDEEEDDGVENTDLYAK